MGTYSQYKTDPELESETGIVVDLGDAGKFRCRRAGGANSAYQREIQRLSRPHRHRMKNGQLPEGVADELLAKVYARTIVIGWEGVTGPDGEPLPFNESNCVKLLLDLPDLFLDLRTFVMDETAFRMELQETDQGNSPSA